MERRKIYYSPPKRQQGKIAYLLSDELSAKIEQKYPVIAGFVYTIFCGVIITAVMVFSGV